MFFVIKILKLHYQQSTVLYIFFSIFKLAIGRRSFMAVFKNSLPVLEIYNIRYMNYRFLLLAVNFGTRPQIRSIRSIYNLILVKI